MKIKNVLLSKNYFLTNSVVQLNDIVISTLNSYKFYEFNVEGVVKHLRDLSLK